MGGLGNQLFQIATTLAYASLHGLRPVFSSTEVASEACVTTPERRTHWRGLLSGLRDLTADLSTLPGWPDGWQLVQLQDVHHFVILEPPRPGAAGVFLDGYFQSYRFFEAEDALSRLGLREQLARARLLVPASSRPGGPSSVCLHFRIGDYRHKPSMHPVLSPSYYLAALRAFFGPARDGAEVAAEAEAVVPVLYLCDDADVPEVLDVYAPPLLAAGFELRPLAPSADAGTQLLAMACCDVNVIANSSFSWWAAFLNPTPDKVVYRPSVWFGPDLAHLQLHDMFPPDWRAVDVVEEA
jgi:hypothetical protein